MRRTEEQKGVRKLRFHKAGTITAVLGSLPLGLSIHERSHSSAPALQLTLAST